MVKGGIFMEKLREKLYNHIEQYGLLDKRTIDTSQKLDKFILKNMSNKLTCA